MKNANMKNTVETKKLSRRAFMGIGLAAIVGCTAKTEPQIDVVEPPVMEPAQIAPPVAARVAPQPVIQEVVKTGAEKILAENPRLSMEQAETLHQLIEDVVRDNLGIVCLNGPVRKTNPNLTSREVARRAIELATKDIDPMLVSKNLVFGKEWLLYVGDNKVLSGQQFQAWVGRLEAVYDSYADLVGSKPRNEKIFVHITPPQQGSAAHAHGGHGASGICINGRNIAQVLQPIRQNSSTTHIVPHEIAHVFSIGREWEIHPEDIVELLVSYAMEKTGFHYGVSSAGSLVQYERLTTSGAQHRRQQYDKAIANMRSARPNPSRYGPESVYLLGLVDEVGWDTYKKVFRSYPDNRRGTPVYTRFMSDEQKVLRARDFFDRVERVSGKPGVLRSLADKGEILDKYFTVATTPLDNVQQAITPQPQPAVTQPPPQTTVPQTTVPPTTPPPSQVGDPIFTPRASLRQ